MINVVELVKQGKGRFEFAELISEHNDHKLYLSIFRDAMKFNDVPALTWEFEPIPGNNEVLDKVRLPATAHQLQEIADLLHCSLMTPRIIDLIWQQATLKFDAVINSGHPRYDIVATMDIHDVHKLIEEQIEKQGGDDGLKLISCVGKYWCLINDLNYKGKVQGDWAACNYGWFAKQASGSSLMPPNQCWQRPGYAHNKLHWDPSQTIRLVYRRAMLVKPDGSEHDVDVHDIATDPELCGLVTHDGKPLTYLRQTGVEELEPLPTHGIIIAPLKRRDEPIA